MVCQDLSLFERRFNHNTSSALSLRLNRMNRRERKGYAECRTEWS